MLSCRRELRTAAGRRGARQGTPPSLAEVPRVSQPRPQRAPAAFSLVVPPELQSRSVRATWPALPLGRRARTGLPTGPKRWERAVLVQPGERGLGEALHAGCGHHAVERLEEGPDDDAELRGAEELRAGLVMVSHPPAPGVGSILPQAAGQASRWGDRDASVSRTILWTRKGPSTTIPTTPPGQVLQHCSPGMWAPRGARSSLWPAPHSQGQATGELHNLHHSSSRPDQGVGLCCVLCRCPKAEHDTSTCASQAIPSFREQHRGLVNVCVVIH